MIEIKILICPIKVIDMHKTPHLYKQEPKVICCLYILTQSFLSTVVIDVSIATEVQMILVRVAFSKVNEFHYTDCGERIEISILV